MSCHMTWDHEYAAWGCGPLKGFSRIPGCRGGSSRTGSSAQRQGPNICQKVPESMAELHCQRHLIGVSSRLRRTRGAGLLQSGVPWAEIDALIIIVIGSS